LREVLQKGASTKFRKEAEMEDHRQTLLATIDNRSRSSAEMMHS
jgi:hypothetical protein